MFLCITAVAIGNAILLLATIIHYDHNGAESVQPALRIAYNVVGLGINWIQFGGVRRGLVGSIIYLGGFELRYAPLILYGASYLAFIMMSFFMLRRMTINANSYLPFLLIFAALLLFWSRDIGRTDMLVAAILIAAALALVDGRIVLASLFIAVGVLVHEAAAIYGLPLLAAILTGKRRYTRFRLDTLVSSAAIIAAGVAIYGLIPIAPHSDNRTIVATITSEDPSIHLDQYTVSLAFYDNLGGMRALETSICTIYGLNHFVQLFIALMMISVAIISLNGMRRVEWIHPVIASFLPIIFLWAIAEDMSRWVTLAIFNVWIVSAVWNSAPVEDGGRRWVWARVVCAAAIASLLYPRVGYDWYPSPLIEKAIEVAIGHPDYKTQEQCDPGWLSLLSQK